MTYEDWQCEILEEVALEVSSQNPLIIENVRYSEFVSKSQGRGRRRRREREIRLVTWRGKTWSIGNRLTQGLEFLMQDIFPEEMAMNSELDWLAAFLEALRNLPKRRR